MKKTVFFDGSTNWFRRLPGLLLLAVGLLAVQTVKSQTFYTWTGSISSSWNDPNNWSPNTGIPGIPGSSDNATIVSASNTCKLNGPTILGNLLILTGTLDLGSYTLTVIGGNSVIQKGTVQNGTLKVTGGSTVGFGNNGPVTMNCVVDVTSSSIRMTKTIFQSTTTFNRTGSINDPCTGNNIFNGPLTVTNSGSGYIMLGNLNPDLYNNAATFNNTGTGSIRVADNSSNNIFNGVTTFNNSPTANTKIFVSQSSGGTIFNGDIVVTSTSGGGVEFCGGNSSSNVTLATGRTISVGPAGYSAGTLTLCQFTQVGTASQGLTLTGTSTLTFGPSASFDGAITSSSPSLFFDGAVFNGVVDCTKNGATNDYNDGNNIFNAPFTVTNTGSGVFAMGESGPDLWQSTAVFKNYSMGQDMFVADVSSGNIFNGDVTFDNRPGSLAKLIHSNYSGKNTQFNGNIIVENVNSGGVFFGESSGNATLANGKTISVGAAGFNSGDLTFRNFTQSGPAAPQNISMTGTGSIKYGPNTQFDGQLTSHSPGLFFNGTKFNGTVDCTKVGTSTDQSVGNNIFNAQSTFTNNGTGDLVMTLNTPDTYIGDVRFVKSNSGQVYPNYNGNSTYAGNLTVGSDVAITFGAGTGTATFSGTSVQNIDAMPGTPAPVFSNMVIANTSGVALNSTPINVSKNLLLAAGLLNTSTVNILTMLSTSVVAAGTALSTSYVNGPMRYQKATSGTSTLNFPIGNGADCRPIVLTVKHASSTLYNYTAQLFNIGANTLGYSFPPTINRVSGVHYYTIARTDAASNPQPTANLSGSSQTIQIFFGANDVVTDGTTLSIAKNTNLSPTQWIDIGGTGAPPYSGGTNLVGSVTSTSSPTAFNSFSNFSLANLTAGGNVLPLGLLHFDARVDKNTVDLDWATSVEMNNGYFTIERSRDGSKFDSLQRVNSETLNGISINTLNYEANDPNPYPGPSYYRLKQTDLDGNHRYSKIVSVRVDSKQPFSIYPSPTTGPIFISGISLDQTSLIAQWYDLSGKSLLQEAVPVQSGTARLLAQFRNGVYLLKLIFPDGSFKIQNIIILK